MGLLSWCPAVQHPALPRHPAPTVRTLLFAQLPALWAASLQSLGHQAAHCAPLELMGLSRAFLLTLALAPAPPALDIFAPLAPLAPPPVLFAPLAPTVLGALRRIFLATL